jgi:hypothetical protein
MLADAVHAHKIEWNPAERRKGRRGKRVQAKGRRVPAHATAKKSNVDIDFVMNIFAPWTGVRWGELMAVEGWNGKDSPGPRFSGDADRPAGAPLRLGRSLAG